MRLTVLHSDEIIQEEWDDFILQSREGNLFATYTYLQGCERAWKATVLYDKEGNYRAVMPFQIRKKYGITYIYQDPFSRELGIFTKEQLSQREYTGLCRTTFESCRYVAKYHFNVDNDADLQQNSFLNKGELTPIYTYHLELNQPYQCIQKNYRKDRKYSIRRAKRYPQHIYQSADISPALEIFTAHTFYRIPGLAAYQISLKEKLFKNLFEQKMVDINYVTFNEKPIAAALVAKYKRKVICLFTSNTKQAFELRSASLLLDYIIKSYAGQKLVFDFKGGGVDSLDNFFQSFGAKRKIVYTYKQNNFPFLIRWLMEIRKKYSRRSEQSEINGTA